MCACSRHGGKEVLSSGEDPCGNVMECHVRSCAPPEMSCFVMQAVSAGLSARSSSRAAARASAAAVGCGHWCLLPGNAKGGTGVSLFRAGSRGRGRAGAGGRIAAARLARPRPRETADAPRPSPPAGVFFRGPQPLLSAEKPKGGPGSRLSLLSFYTMPPNVKPIREQKMKTPEIFHGLPVETRAGATVGWYPS